MRVLPKNPLALLAFIQAIRIVSRKFNADIDAGATTATQPSGETTPGDGDPLQDWMGSRAHIYPGRFNQTEYDNVTVEVQYNPNKNAAPHTRDDCAPGLHCKFSDRVWHATGWHNQFVVYANSMKKPNAVRVSTESHARRPEEVPSDIYRGFAGIATTDLRSDIPLALKKHPIKSYYERGKSTNITKWKILYVQSNCHENRKHGNVISGRDMVMRKLMKRGLVDSYGECHNNAAIPDWLSKHDRQTQKQELIKMYAFTAAFENSIYPGYATGEYHTLQIFAVHTVYHQYGSSRFIHFYSLSNINREDMGTS